MTNEYSKMRTRSGMNFAMNENLYEQVCYNDSQGLTLDIFETILNAGAYFPQINRFVATLVLLFLGYRDWVSIFLVNILIGGISTFVWHHSSMYKIYGMTSAYFFIGAIIFKNFLHIVLFLVLAIFVFHDWKICLAVILAGLVSSAIESWMSGYRNTYKQNNEIAEYSIEKTNQKW